MFPVYTDFRLLLSHVRHLCAQFADNPSSVLLCHLHLSFRVERQCIVTGRLRQPHSDAQTARHTDSTYPRSAVLLSVLFVGILALKEEISDDILQARFLLRNGGNRMDHTFRHIRQQDLCRQLYYSRYAEKRQAFYTDAAPWAQLTLMADIGVKQTSCLLLI